MGRSPIEKDVLTHRAGQQGGYGHVTSAAHCMVFWAQA